MQSAATVVKDDASGYPAYILAAVDELVYGYHSIFILIHLLLGRRKDGKTNEGGFLKPLYCDWHLQCGERQRHTCLKEYFYMLTRRLLFEDGVCAFPHHVVDGLHDVEHFLRHAGKGSVHTNDKKCTTHEALQIILVICESLRCPCQRFLLLLQYNYSDWNLWRSKDLKNDIWKRKRNSVPLTLANPRTSLSTVFTETTFYQKK